MANPTPQWKYEDRHDKQAPEVFELMEGVLNQLSDAADKSAKLAITDVSHRDARGVLYYSDDFQQPPERPPLDWVWKLKTWESSDLTLLFPKVRDALNGGENLNLTSQQAYYALVCMTDHSSHGGRRGLYWLGKRL